MEHCKLQAGCLLFVLYIVFAYCKECRRFKQEHKFSIFAAMLMLAVISILLDAATAYTVNNLETVNRLLNQVLHLFFLISLDAFIFMLFIYMLSITTGIPKRKYLRWLLYFPFIANVLVVVYNISELEYREGRITNYSMGISAYTCFAMAGIYILFTIIIFLKHWENIEKHKRISIFTYLLVLAGIVIYQMIYPQALLSSLCVAIIVLGEYVNQENPAVAEISHYHNEMVIGFATLVENKDGSTGGHIKRTSLYVSLLAKELRRKGYYKDILTRDYVENLCKAAPMHDIGKIAVPDVILQKPGKLTDEEFDIMKQHAPNGGEIIQETFGHLGNEQYTKIAYQVARYHHEKWNGKGYPEGIKGEEIPLCARTMAVADVFDAISQSRCYRKAMPLEKCFEIIEEGSGQDFDPILTEVFLEIRDKVEEVYRQISDTQ